MLFWGNSRPGFRVLTSSAIRLIPSIIFISLGLFTGACKRQDSLSTEMETEDPNDTLEECPEVEIITEECPDPEICPAPIDCNPTPTSITITTLQVDSPVFLHGESGELLDWTRSDPDNHVQFEVDPNKTYAATVLEGVDLYTVMGIKAGDSIPMATPQINNDPITTVEVRLENIPAEVEAATITSGGFCPRHLWRASDSTTFTMEIRASCVNNGRFSLTLTARDAGFNIIYGSRALKLPVTSDDVVVIDEWNSRLSRFDISFSRDTLSQNSTFNTVHHALIDDVPFPIETRTEAWLVKGYFPRRTAERFFYSGQVFYGDGTDPARKMYFARKLPGDAYGWQYHTEDFLLPEISGTEVSDTSARPTFSITTALDEEALDGYLLMSRFSSGRLWGFVFPPDRQSITVPELPQEFMIELNPENFARPFAIGVEGDFYESYQEFSQDGVELLISPTIPNDIQSGFIRGVTYFPN